MPRGEIAAAPADPVDTAASWRYKGIGPQGTMAMPAGGVRFQALTRVVRAAGAESGAAASIAAGDTAASSTCKPPAAKALRRSASGMEPGPGRSGPLPHIRKGSVS